MCHVRLSHVIKVLLLLLLLTTVSEVYATLVSVTCSMATQWRRLKWWWWSSETSSQSASLNWTPMVESVLTVPLLTDTQRIG